MTHRELDELAHELHRKINVAIVRGFPSWSRFARNQMIDKIVTELAPQWDYAVVSMITGAPRVRLTQYRGDVS
jgi:hypothetical protein